MRDSRIDDYIAGKADFARPILAWLRERVHGACPAVEESIKWSRPFFSHRGKPLANMAAFQAHASFDFWDRTIEPYGRIESLGDLPDAATFEEQVRDAVARIDAGPRPARAKGAKPEAEVPGELAEALAGDALASATFETFPPGQRREYCAWIAEAKQAATRIKRATQAVEWMREGKRRNWKYES